MIRFHALDLTAPDGTIVGVIERGTPALHASGVPRVGPDDPLPETPGPLILDHALSRADAFEKTRAVTRLLRLRRSGATLILISHDETLLENCADEIWWIQDGKLVHRGDPREVLDRYHRQVAAQLRAAGEHEVPVLAPAMRKGDGRALIDAIELVGESGASTSVWRSGEPVAIRVTVRYTQSVADPVVGLMIRTRVGLHVYGTNTELEQLKLGPVSARDILRITYRFRCELCPGDYTLTAASHDPDGVWHDWMEDAVAFTVTDIRYTAGVANLRAHVEFTRDS